jgi:molybdopterin biosynthesis enzyme
LRVQTSPRQDSALTQVFAQANCLLRREAHGPGLKIDDKVELLPL